MKRERSLMIAVALLSVAVMFLAYRAFYYEPSVVVGEAFQLVDANGNKKAVLGISPEGTVALGLLDEQGNVRASIGLLPDGTPVAVMKDKNGKPVWGAP